tara:strand:+ start:332 stop:550 length:219 start_codon:yes stop_codon:yes gene_type:complete
MEIYKTRKTPVVCSHPKCVRVTRRHNGLCVRHRNDTKLVNIFNTKSAVFQHWCECMRPMKDEIFGEWELLKI